MRTTLWLLCLLVAWPIPGLAEDVYLEQARHILQEVPLVDGHNDLPWQYLDRVGNRLGEMPLDSDLTKFEGEHPVHTDLARLKAGGVGGQFWSVYIPVEQSGPGAARAFLEQIDLVHRLVERYPDRLELALTADDVVRIHGQGKLASLIGIEGGHALEGSLAVLRQMYRCGGRYMTLTHWKTNAIADAATDAPEHGGLSPFGVETVKEMNRLGMLVDLSHVSEETMADALEVSRAPVIFSHSSARSLCGHARNVPDAILSRMKDNGGVVMVNFAAFFTDDGVRNTYAGWKAEETRLKTLYPGAPETAKTKLEEYKEQHPLPETTLEQVADHIDHLRRVAGIDHVGLGSDFDGIETTPRGLEDVSRYPYLLAELLRRGYTEEEIKKIAGLNVLRALREAEGVARELQATQPPSEAKVPERAPTVVP